MRLRSTNAGEYSETGHLLAENARLRRLCAQTEAVAARHATMLREGDHRIKNSLQIVASLLSQQARRTQNASVRAALSSAATRIQSIGFIHDALQAGPGADVVNLGVVLKTLCESLHAMAGDTAAVAIVADVEAVETPAALAHPIVLAVNELVVNALRHAFPGDRSGAVRVSLAHVDNELRVVVADDGRGLTASHAEDQGYGITLVRMLATQVGGALSIESHAGSRFTLVVPAPGVRSGM